ncbi:MAG TPA: hypothetical protein PLD59_02090 [Tepidisphaeraceae bacterium]|nr:hypothetical protein [Tepidisphaeraceae bacterium]
MRTATETLDTYFQEMRWRALSLAADLDRIARAPGGEAAMADPRLTALKQCLEVLTHDTENRAAKVQMILSDTSAPPER